MREPPSLGRKRPRKQRAEATLPTTFCASPRRAQAKNLCDAQNSECLLHRMERTWRGLGLFIGIARTGADSAPIIRFGNDAVCITARDSPSMSRPINIAPDARRLYSARPDAPDGPYASGFPSDRSALVQSPFRRARKTSAMTRRYRARAGTVDGGLPPSPGQRPRVFALVGASHHFTG